MGWHTNPLMLLHNRQYFYGDKYKLPIPVGHLLPAQFIRENGAGRGDITRMEVIDEAGTVTDVLSSASGMIDYKSSPGGFSYDVVRFRGTIPLTGTWEVGWYRALISDGIDTWQSDWFLWTDTPLMKVEWWHVNHIAVSEGHIDYSDGFKFWVYLNTDIGMPQYPYEEEVDRRAGVDLPFRKTSSKQYQFLTIVSEYLMDCMRLIPTNAEIRIYHLDDVLRVTKLRHAPISWIERGDVAKTVWTFLTDTVTSTFAQTIGSLAMPGLESCLDVRFIADSFLLDPYQAVNWPDEGTNGFNPPTYAMYSDTDEDGGELWFIPGNGQRPYLAQVQQGDIIFVRNSQKYYLVSSYQGGSAVTPRVLAVAESPTYTITGIVLPGSTIQIQYRSEGSGWQTAQTVSDSAFNAGIDLGPDAANWTQVRLVLSSPSCGEIFTTPAYSLAVNDQPGSAPSGVDYDVIGTTLEVYESN